MKKFQETWEQISPLLTQIHQECIDYLTELLSKEEYKNGISCETEDGSSTCVTYDGGNHPEYASNAFSTVKGVFMKDGRIYLSTEDCDEYPIDRIETLEIVGVCDFIEDYCISRNVLRRLVESRGNRIDLSEKNIILYDEDTKKKEGESCKVLSIFLDVEGNLYVEVEYYGTDEWHINDLNEYEVNLILDGVWS